MSMILQATCTSIGVHSCIEQLHVILSPIDANTSSLLHAKIISQYKCAPHSSHSHNPNGASLLVLYYQYVSL